MTFPPHLRLLGFAACILTSGCTDHASIEKAKALEAELEQHGQLLSRARQDLQRLEAKLNAAERENSTIKDQKAKVEADRDAAIKDLETLKKDFERYKLQYKMSMKTRAPGMHVADFTADGVQYKNVTIKEFNDTQLSISHDFGVGKISLAVLPESLRDLLGLNITVAENRDAPITDPRAARKKLDADNMKSVNDANEKHSAVAAALGDAKRKLHETQAKIDVATYDHRPVDSLKRTLAELQAKIAKLEGQLAQADIEQFQARQNQRTAIGPGR